MKVAVGAFLFLIYTFVIFMGTPALLLVLQTVALLVVGIVIAAIAIQRRTIIFPPAFLILLGISILFFIGSMILGLERGQMLVATLVRYLQVFSLTFAGPLLGYSLVELGLITGERLVRNIVYAIVAYTCMKLIIVGVAAAFNIPQIIMLDFFEFAFNADPTFGVFLFNIARFFGPTDFLNAFALYYCLFLWTGRWRIVVILLLCAGIFVSYSRFVWLECLFTLGLYCFKLSRAQLLALLLAIIVVSPLAMSLPSITVIEQRFFSVGVQAADELRHDQTEALTQDMDQNFFFGHGFGSFSYKDVRDHMRPYNYEEQWLAIIYQLGAVGLLVVLGLLTCAVVPLVEVASLEGITLLLLFSFSLLSGFANPSLIGRAAGVGFAFVYFCAAMLRDQIPGGAVKRPDKYSFKVAGANTG